MFGGIYLGLVSNVVQSSVAVLHNFKVIGKALFMMEYTEK